MTLEIEIESLIGNKLTSDQFTICYLLLKKEYDLLNAYLTTQDFQNFEVDIKYLIDNKFLERYEITTLLDLKGYLVTAKYKDMVITGDFFDELLENYPSKVIRPDGSSDFLRTDLKRCRTKYTTKTKNKRVKHEHILKCLKFEVSKRVAEGSLKYMKRLPKWLESEEWTAYEDAIKDSANTTIVHGYGTELE
jgi:hypothetical protein